MLTFSKQLKALRKERKLTQRELAEILGLKLRSYQQYEYRETTPSYEGLIRIADFFGVSLDYLIGREWKTPEVQPEEADADITGEEPSDESAKENEASFAERLRLLRKERKIKQKDMAEHLNMSLRGYQCYEYGRCYPEVSGLLSMADFFGVSVDYLLGRTDQREVNR